ncbi:precorrin-8X methylmutase [Acidianus hospitalis]|uniref:Precorrin-8X methylmutase n=1 Tax=Acidianus hospitalis TaxID=563177 RepID=A0A2T9X472_9CREN|nr:precorrin-8X methylmutase [Acidianus hospitalis]
MNVDTAIIIITHGSRRNTFVEDMEGVAKYIEDKLQIPVYLSHNEFTEPNWRNLVSSLLEKGINKFIFALAFLGRGNHVAKDIMGSFGVNEFYKWEEAQYEGRKVKVYFTRPLADSPLVKLSLLYRISSAVRKDNYFNFLEDPEEIEENSMELSRQKVREITGKDGEELEIISRAVYASGNLEIARYIYISKDAIEMGVSALKSGVGILIDVKMVKAGLRWNAENYLDDAVELAKKLKITRTAAGIRIGLSKEPKIVVIGNSPTALVEAIKMHEEEGVEIPLIVATPPGFTNAVEAKEKLISTDIPCIVLRGNYGGSNIAVSIMNEIIRYARGKNG